jgi:hypothetical protein
MIGLKLEIISNPIDQSQAAQKIKHLSLGTHSSLYALTPADRNGDQTREGCDSIFSDEYMPRDNSPLGGDG